MKIAVIADGRVPSERAYAVAIANTCQGFAELGHNVTLILPYNKNNSLKGVEENYGFVPRFSMLELQVAQPRFLPRKLWFAVKSWSFAFKVRKYLKTADFDLVYTRSQYVAFLCGCVFEAHQYSFTKMLMTRKCRLVCITKVIRDAYRRGIVAHLGYRRHPVTKLVKSKILVLGDPKTKVGKGITVVKGIPNKDIYNYLEGADVLFLPSTGKWNSPLKLLDYLSTNKPIIYPNQPNVIEIVNEKPMTWAERAKLILEELNHDTPAKI